MTAIFMPTGSVPLIVNAATMGYMALGSTADDPTTTTESNVTTVWRVAGTFSNLYANVIANTITAATAINYRVGSANGNQTLSYGSGVIGELIDSTHSDVAAAGNLINYQIVGGGTGTSISIGSVGEQFAPTTTTNTVNKLAATLVAGFVDTSANVTYYNCIAGNISNNTTEANAQFKNQSAATLQNLVVIVSANTASIATVNSRIGGANGNLSASITSGTTGNIEDTTHSDGISAGNLINYSYDATVVVTLTINKMAVDYLTTNGATHYVSGNVNASFVNTNKLISITGRVFGYSTETQASVKTGLSFTASLLEAFVVSNSNTNNPTLKFRKNGLNANQSIIITSNISGFFNDSIHTDSITPNDEINTEINVDASGGVGLGNVGFLASYPASVGGSSYTISEGIQSGGGSNSIKNILSGGKMFHHEKIKRWLFPKYCKKAA